MARTWGGWDEDAQQRAAIVDLDGRGAGRRGRLGVIALVRGEQISAAWLIFAAVGSYAIAYRFYARFIARTCSASTRRRATPAERLDNDVDYQPTDRRVLFGHHFAAIAGAGPLVGPVLAAQMGYLPGTIWIIVGVIFAGAVQDMVTLFFSMRRDGKSLGQMARDEIGPVGGAAALIAVFAIMIILLAVLALVVVNALAQSPWGTFSLAMTIPIAFFMGFYMRVLRPGRVLETTAIGVTLLLLAIALGGVVRTRASPTSSRSSPETLALVPDRLRLRRLGAAGLDAAGAARLPVDVHEDRHDHAARGRHPRDAADDEERGGDEVRLHRRGPGVRGRAVPVRVHHDRLRRAVGLPLADRLGHDAEDDREGDAGAVHRLRRDADGVVRGRDGDHRRLASSSRGSTTR